MTESHVELSRAAPYVLGALDDLERTRYERHLATCDECAVEVAELRAGLDAIAVAESIDPPARVRAAVLEQIESIDQLPATLSSAPRVSRGLWDCVGGGRGADRGIRFLRREFQ